MDLIGARSLFAPELQNPSIRNRLFGMTHAEVGGQGPEAQQAFLESIFNRASARNQPLGQTLSGSYFPAITYNRAARGVNDSQRGRYEELLDQVLGGSNRANYATGNASGTVGFAGGPQTAAYGGERFGVEGPDRSWAQQMGFGGEPMAYAGGSPAGELPQQAPEYEIPQNAQSTSGILPQGNRSMAGGILGGNQPLTLGNGILGYLAGALQGGNLGQSIGRGLEGYTQGAEMDQKNQREQMLSQFVGQMPDVPANLRPILAANPQLAQAYIEQLVKPELTPDIKNFNFRQKHPDFQTYLDQNSDKFSNSPVYTQNPDGSIGILQTSKAGGAKAVDLAPGTKILPPGNQKIDTGTGTIIQDRAGNTVSNTPKDIAGAKSLSEQGKGEGQAKVALPQIEQQTSQILGNVDQLKTHPGKAAAVGFFAGRLPALTPEAADFVERVEQLKGGAFLQAYTNSLKGSGQISNIEGEKGTTAKVRLNRAKDEGDFDKALDEYASLIKGDLDVARKKAGGKSEAPASSAPVVKYERGPGGTLRRVQQ